MRISEVVSEKLYLLVVGLELIAFAASRAAQLPTRGTRSKTFEPRPWSETNRSTFYERSPASRRIRYANYVG
jgi:hypothetical protein